MANATTEAGRACKAHGFSRAVAVKAGVKIYQGAMVGIDNASGYAVVGGTGQNNKVIGIAARTADNTSGTDAAISVIVESGIYLFPAVSADVPIIIDGAVYAADDSTIKKTQGTSPAAGILFEIDQEGLWVKLGY
ncbi:MAG: hypothetical protein ORO03_10015 [Alphaproteobacteria bacterium]|nr:hypothetical protein [Alphaproteobacteria bacterium]